MSVLTLTGKPINWASPPKPTTKVMWSQRTTDGKRVYGSLRTICALDRLNRLAKKRFGCGLIVYQGAYNTTIASSEGTHDLDAALDVWIPGVPGLVQQRFFRANGAGAFYRTPRQGFMEHIHMFILPTPSHSGDVSRRWQQRGYKVGYLLDGGWSTRGKIVSSSQIANYYNHDDALADHSRDVSWFPPDIDETVFRLAKYIAHHAQTQEKP